MQNYCVFLLLPAFCFSGVFTLKCDGVGSAGFSDKKASRQVLNFLDMVAKEFSGREVTNENILEHIDHAHFKNPKVEALLCEFKDLVRIQSFGFKCFACKTVFFGIKLFGGNDPDRIINFFKDLLDAACDHFSWVPFVQSVCDDYREKGDVGAVLIKGVIKNDGGVDPEHICETIDVC